MLRWPGVVQPAELDVEPLFAEASALFDTALDAIRKMRSNEGQRIADMLESRCSDIEAIAKSVRARMPEVLEAFSQVCGDMLGLGGECWGAPSSGPSDEASPLAPVAADGVGSDLVAEKPVQIVGV